MVYNLKKQLNQTEPKIETESIIKINHETDNSNNFRLLIRKKHFIRTNNKIRITKSLVALVIRLLLIFAFCVGTKLQICIQISCTKLNKIKCFALILSYSPIYL